VKTVKIIEKNNLPAIEADIQKLLDSGYNLHTFTGLPDNFVAVLIKEKKTERTSQRDKLISKALEGMTFKCLQYQLKWAVDFIAYRKQIKKGLKTERPLRQYLKELDKLCENGYKVTEVVETMKEREWQTLKLEYFDGHSKSQNEFI